MEVLALAHAYVKLDRAVFFQSASTFVSSCYMVRDRLKRSAGALKDFRDLCEAGCHDDELLWLLNGCEGLPGFSKTYEAFGWTAEELTRGITSIEKATNVIVKLERFPVGLLAVHALRAYGLERTLRSYVELARAAKDAFGHGSEWFLNIAKARLVIHVRHHTKELHDPEISGLIAAVTRRDYAPTAHSRWRRTHAKLIRDSSLDPYTVMTQEQRKLRRKSWEELATEMPEIFKASWDEWVHSHGEINKHRKRLTKPQRHKN